MNLYKFLLLVSMLTSPVALAEYHYFSCKTQKGNVLLSEKGNTLSYSLNKNDKPEFSYLSKGKGFEGFTYNHYSRYQTNYVNVSFINHEYMYIIYSIFDNGKQTRGINVTNLKNQKEYNYPCQSLTTDHLIELTERLTCNTDSAPGCN